MPPHVEYSLTYSGKALIPIWDAIGEWNDRYLD
ncbi:MAG: winged helix-turn-helix transcriptional regulator [Peptostreptococcaceae bacterium]|nr:winged helix-turn-helix transcriptional regulator [Peptostreptococcaceae bacterium]